MSPLEPVCPICSIPLTVDQHPHACFRTFSNGTTEQFGGAGYWAQSLSDPNAYAWTINGENGENGETVVERIERCIMSQFNIGKPPEKTDAEYVEEAERELREKAGITPAANPRHWVPIERQQAFEETQKRSRERLAMMTADGDAID